MLQAKAVEALIHTYLDNCAKTLRGEEPSGIHICFGCGNPFRIDEAVYCPICNWWRAPCGHCGCSLELSARVALEKAFQSICGKCVLNPKKRKSSNVIRGVTRDDFVKWVEKIYPNLAADYHAGRLSFDKLLLDVQTRSDLVWVF